MIPRVPRRRAVEYLPPSARLRNPRGFSLIELLVAITILAVIVVVVAQIFSASSSAISSSNKGVNALDASQAVFQQLDLDISRMVLRNDVDYAFVKSDAGGAGDPGNDSISFYAEAPGLSEAGGGGTPPRPLSVVAYQVVQDSLTELLELQYGALQIDWTSTGSHPFVPTSPLSTSQLLTTLDTPAPNTLPTVTSFVNLAPEVIRMEICFQLASDPVTSDSPPHLLTKTVPAYGSATSIPFPIHNLAGIFVGLVVIDPKSRLLLPKGADLKVAQLFPDAVDNQDILSLWTPYNTASNLEAAGVPPQAVEGIHVYQKYFPLPW